MALDMTLGRTLYGAHAATVGALCLVLAFGRATHFNILVLLVLILFLLSLSILALTVLRRHGFATSTTLGLLLAPPLAVMCTGFASDAWRDSRWPADRPCLQRLAESATRDFPDVEPRTTVWLDGSSGSHLMHPRSQEIDDRMRACGLTSVAITSDQTEFLRDDLFLRAGGYVLRRQGLPPLSRCPYIMTHGSHPPRQDLGDGWYYCR
jgi:hypothetical protein